jgi:hypothetical protein
MVTRLTLGLLSWSRCERNLFGLNHIYNATFHRWSLHWEDDGGWSSWLRTWIIPLHEFCCTSATNTIRTAIRPNDEKWNSSKKQQPHDGPKEFHPFGFIPIDTSNKIHHRTMITNNKSCHKGRLRLDWPNSRLSMENLSLSESDQLSQAFLWQLTTAWPRNSAIRSFKPSFPCSYI